MKPSRLVIDIGGTNVRLACADDVGQLHSIVRYRTSNFASFQDAISAYLSTTEFDTAISSCAIAAAGPVDDGHVRLTNACWTVDREDAKRILGGIPVVLVNDLEAVAAALPHLSASDMTHIGGPKNGPYASRTKLAFNVGTGCGAAIAISCGGKWRTAPSEAGHMTLATDSPSIAGLVPSGATVETVLSGAGVVALYTRIANRSAPSASDALDAAAIFAGAGDHDISRRTVEALCEVLGCVTGNLVLATAAWGGVYFVGSVATGWAHVADAVRFRAAFERKGAMTERMRNVPSYIVEREDVALFGLAKVEIAAAPKDRCGHDR